MVFWIGFTLMVLNEGFVMMRHISPFFDNLRKKVIKKLGENVWYRLHGTLDYTWIGLVTLGLIVNSNRVVHLSILLIFWFASFCIFYLPRYISNTVTATARRTRSTRGTRSRTGTTRTR